MYKCEICNKNFEDRYSFSGHFNTHSRILKNKIYNCKFCNKEFDNSSKLGSHVRMCKLSPTYSERIQKMINTNKKNRDENWQIENGKKISKTIMEKVENGTWHTSYKKTRICEYNGVKFHGTWELEYAKWLDDNNVKWRRPTEKFPYVFEGKNRHYTPDFYLIETDEYVEIKGYETDKDRAKWNQFPTKLKILKSKDLKKLKLNINY